MVEIQKLISGPQPESSQAPLLSPKTTPHKMKPIVELKTPLSQCLGKEQVAEAPKIVVPVALVPIATEMTERESETPKTTSFDPFLKRMSTRKTKKDPTPDPSSEEEDDGSSEELEEEEVASSNNELESREEEAEPTTPPPEKKRFKTWASEQCCVVNHSSV